MSVLDATVRSARTRLTANVLFEQLAVSAVYGCVAGTLAELIDRALAWSAPANASLILAAGAFVLRLGAGLWLQRVAPMQAALAVDRAAGLKERLSTALAVRRSGDAFAMAAVRDAERVAKSIHVPTHIRLVAPPLLPWSLSVAACAVLIWLFMPELNLLAATPASNESNVFEARKVHDEISVAVREQVERVEQRVEQNPALAGLAEPLKQLELPLEPSATPEDVRREAVKQIDNVAEQLRKQLEQTPMRAVDDLKSQLARLDAPPDDDPAAKLASDLVRGDFSEARKSLEQMRDELRESEQKGDPESRQKLQELGRKLDELARQMDQLNGDERIRKELERRAGMSGQQIEQLMNTAAEADPAKLQSQLEQQLQQSGMTAEQAQKLAQEMAEKISKNEHAKQALKEMSQSMRQAASACQQPGENPSPGGTGQKRPSDALEGMAGQLSAADAAEQLMQELQAQLEQLRDLKDAACQGGGTPGERPSDKPGENGSEAGRGRGARAGHEAVAQGLQTTRLRGETRDGQIIGQMLIDAPMLTGEAQAAVYDAVQSAVRDATDAIEREQVPQQYERVLRLYFERLAGLVPVAPPAAGEGQRESVSEDEPAPESESP